MREENDMSFQEAFDFSGKTILIAGASSGIGREIAISFSNLGAKLILLARREEKLKETLKLLLGENHQYYVIDLVEINTIETMMKKIVAEHGILDGLVYSAGIGATFPINIMKPEKVDAALKINFCAFYEMVRQFVKKKNCARGAKIVGISSMASIQSNKGQSIYAASKAAMDMAVRCLAQELSEKGITINTIQPAWVATEMYQEYLTQNPDKEKEIREKQPLGVITPAVIAQQAVYLFSPYADKITGTSISVGSGQV